MCECTTCRGIKTVYKCLIGDIPCYMCKGTGLKKYITTLAEDLAQSNRITERYRELDEFLLRRCNECGVSYKYCSCVPYNDREDYPGEP